MRVDGPLVTPALPDVAAAARSMEAAGYDGALTFEGPHDPFLPLLLAADATEHLELTTGVAIAFDRNFQGPDTHDRSGGGGASGSGPPGAYGRIS